MASQLKLVTRAQSGIKPSRTLGKPIKPARTLGKPGAALWQSIMSDYEIADAGGLEMLTAACQALDRAESLREQIDRDGVIARGARGPKEHPGLKHELAARAFTVRTLQRLGLDVQPIKPIGRPGKPIAWQGHEE